MRHFVLLATVLFTLPPGVFAQGTDDNPVDYTTARFERILHAQRIDERITLDGKLTEKAWETAERAEHFSQWEPHPGMPSLNDTIVRVLFDDDNLYVGARCLDSDTKHMTVNELKKDFEGAEGDTFGVFFDTLHDQQTGFYFGTNPAGARRDYQSSRDGDQLNQDWDGVWDVKTSVDDQGWTAEFVIPFKTLRFSSASQQIWGLNFLRRLRRLNEDSHWSPLPRRYRTARSSMSGTLEGLENVHQGRNLKIKPYVIGGFDETGATGAGRSTTRDGGFDFKYGLTQSVTLDLTYRTDFSQVEADQQQINLTRFNLFFPEKREFFLENAGVFGIAGGGRGGGGDTNVLPFFSRRIGLSAAGTPIPILGGARASGRLGSYEIGLLSMKTRSVGATPSTNFAVARVRKTLAGNSTIGAIVTSRDSALEGRNRLYGADTLLRVHEKLEISSYLLSTHAPGLVGHNQARLLGAGWRDNDFTLSGQYEQVQPNFRPEVGFVRRPDNTHYSADVAWRPRPRRNKTIRNYNFTGDADYIADAGGALETRTQGLHTGISFQNSSQFTVNMNHTFDRLTEPFAIRSSVILPSGDYDYLQYSASYSSDNGRNISGRLNAGAGEFWDGHSRSISGALSLKPSYHLNVDINFSRTDARLLEGNFVTNLVGARILYAISPKAFLNSFLQYNASTHQFTTNTRFNILHRPLSDLYVVYNEGRDINRHSLVARTLAVKFTDMFGF